MAKFDVDDIVRFAEGATAEPSTRLMRVIRPNDDHDFVGVEWMEGPPHDQNVISDAYVASDLVLVGKATRGAK